MNRWVLIPIFVVVAANGLAVLPYAWRAFQPEAAVPRTYIEPGGAHASKEELGSHLSILAAAQNLLAAGVALFCFLAGRDKRWMRRLVWPVVAAAMGCMVLTEAMGWVLGRTTFPDALDWALRLIRYGVGAAGPLLLLAALVWELRRYRVAAGCWIAGLVCIGLDDVLGLVRAGFMEETFEVMGAMWLLVALTLVLDRQVGQALRERP